MKIEYFKQKHVPMIQPWLEAHAMKDVPLPQIGFIAMDEKPIAAAFLRRIEGNLGLFDGLIADPASSGKRRSRAIDLVVEGLIKEAKRLDMTQLLGFTHESAVLRRSLKHGFEIQPDRFIHLKV